MKRSTSPGTKGEETRRAILHAALASFRKRGFDATTMRDVAKEAGVALGSAYYYFPSKEALVFAYYESTQIEHEAVLRAKPSDDASLQGRLGALVHGKLDVLRRDRKILGALFRSVGDPSDRVSPFSRETESLRERSVALFVDALAPEPLDEQTKRVAALAFWGLHLALLVYFIHDDSPKQHKTHELADAAIELAVQVLKLAPLLGATVGARLHDLLTTAGLMVTPPDGSKH
jgi:AcrR family transcriptional regulator